MLIGINVLEGPGALNEKQRQAVQYGYWRLGQLFPECEVGDHASLNFEDNRHGGTIKYHLTRNDFDGTTYTFVSGFHSRDWGDEQHLKQHRYVLEIALFHDSGEPYHPGETEE